MRYQRVQKTNQLGRSTRYKGMLSVLTNLVGLAARGRRRESQGVIELGCKLFPDLGNGIMNSLYETL